MSKLPTICASLVALSVATLRPARAADAPAPTPQAARPAPESTSPDPYETRRIVDVSLLGGGVVVGAIGATLAIKYNHAIGGCTTATSCPQEDARVPLGLGMLMVGGAMALAGSIFWLQIPSTSTRVAFSPAGASLVGTF